MSNEKKDLTRIEDLGEFTHEFEGEGEPMSETQDELPELPITDDLSHFESETELETELETETEIESEFTSEFPPDFETQEESSPFMNPEDSLFIEDLQEERENGPLPSHTPFEERNDLGIEVGPQSFKAFEKPETFEDLKKFSENSSFSNVTSEASPSYSVLIKNVRFIEDVNDMISLIKEFGLLTDSEEQMKARFQRGPVLIPRISEYTAIFLAHKLRRFDIDLEIGLSEFIHRPKNEESPEFGIVSKFQLHQNQKHHFEFGNSKLSLSDIKVVSSPTLEGFEITHYFGVATEHKILEAETIESENSQEIMSVYQELANKLKAHALKMNSNAVVGINYQLTPLVPEISIGRHKYKLTCMGNLVWANKI